MSLSKFETELSNKAQSIKKESFCLRKLISSQDFINEDSSSPNILLVKKLVEFVRNNHGDEIPGIPARCPITAFKTIFFPQLSTTLCSNVSQKTVQ